MAWPLAASCCRPSGLPTGAKHNVLNTCIYSLRRKLQFHGAPHRIHTVRGVGFSARTR
ncbi:winged helix-turn-helix domain-containing protein [Rhodococcus wratislaviensis]|uniref:winged helix-turn-helix domain-containing protein n=1 Tax=Rhodococcus wratislaviensis TaxID=44752 RepID=UPI00390889B9